MSGGYFNHAGRDISEGLEAIGNAPQVIQRWPRAASLLKDLAKTLERIEHDIDWDLSGDTSIRDDEAFDVEVVAAVLNVAMRNCPDLWFPRGKWATIQAIQEREEWGGG